MAKAPVATPSAAATAAPKTIASSGGQLQTLAAWAQA